MSPARQTRARLMAFAALCTIASLLAAGAVLAATHRAGAGGKRVPAAAVSTEALAVLGARDHLLYLVSDGDANRQVALLPLDALDATPQLTPLSCQRVYYTAGRGLCLGSDPYRGG